MKKFAAAATLLSCLLIAGGVGISAAQAAPFRVTTPAITMEQQPNGSFKAVGKEPPKTFAIDSKIQCRKVFYKNRFNITIAADMYLPEGFDQSKKYSAIIIGHPYGGVKEQSSGLYAQEMAKRGFVALAFDYSYNGESGGTPRQTVSPETFVEDFSASVDFLGTRPFINRQQIGVIGICGSGGFSVSAAAIDPRIKALATSACTIWAALPVRA